MKRTVARRVRLQLELTEADLDLLVALSGFKSRARGSRLKELARKGLMAEAGVVSPSPRAEGVRTSAEVGSPALPASRPVGPKPATGNRSPRVEPKDDGKAVGEAGFDAGMAEFLDGLGLDVADIDLPRQPG
jgi:hypothetical protein